MDVGDEEGEDERKNGEGGEDSTHRSTFENGLCTEEDSTVAFEAGVEDAEEEAPFVICEVVVAGLSARPAGEGVAEGWEVDDEVGALG